MSGIFLFNVLSNILAPYFSHYNHVRAVGRYEIFVRIQLNEIKLLVLVNLGSFLVLFFFPISTDPAGFYGASVVNLSHT